MHFCYYESPNNLASQKIANAKDHFKEQTLRKLNLVKTYICQKGNANEFLCDVISEKNSVFISPHHVSSGSLCWNNMIETTKLSSLSVTVCYLNNNRTHQLPRFTKPECFKFLKHLVCPCFSNRQELHCFWTSQSYDSQIS